MTPPPCDRVRWIFSWFFCSFLVYLAINETYFSHVFSMFEAKVREPVTISLCQLLRYQRRYSWSLACTYSPYLACLKLEVKHKVSFESSWRLTKGLKEKEQITPGSVTPDCHPHPPYLPHPSAKKFTLSMFFCNPSLRDIMETSVFNHICLQYKLFT